jgi:hypothetical protein
MSHSELGLAAAVFHPGTAAAPTFDPEAPADNRTSWAGGTREYRRPT